MPRNVDVIDTKLVALATEFLALEGDLDTLGLEEDRETGDRQLEITAQLKAAHARQSVIAAQLGKMRPVGPEGFAAMARVGLTSPTLAFRENDELFQLIAALLERLAEAPKRAG